ncbi:MAG: endonuclease V, partial [Pseudomonadota bacterium]
MIVCLDVQYTKKHACAAAVIINSWDALSPALELVKVVDIEADYIAGEFYKRELNPLLSIVNQLDEDIP